MLVPFFKMVGFRYMMAQRKVKMAKLSPMKPRLTM